MIFLTEYLSFHYFTIPIRLFFIFILDYKLGELSFIVHPVVLIGKLISNLEKFLRKIFNCIFPMEKDEFLNSQKRKMKERMAGTLLVLIVCAVSFIIPCCIELFFFTFPSIFHLQKKCFPFNFALTLILDVFWGYQSIAARCLYDEALNVYKSLSLSIEEGRNAVSRIVGRDTKSLDEKGVIKACVETVAENTTDGIFSPIIFYTLGGAPFAFLYKAINTMDSMIAYKNDRYRFFGTVAARFDDIANFIPARIAALFMILSTPFVNRKNFKNAVKVFFRDRYNHESPNSAQTESVMAGILGVELNGDAIYEGKIEHKPTVGNDIRPIEKNDIKRSVKVMYLASVIFFIVIESFFLLFILKN